MVFAMSLFLFDHQKKKGVPWIQWNDSTIAHLSAQCKEKGRVKGVGFFVFSVNGKAA